jgi:hypothetical protein
MSVSLKPRKDRFGSNYINNLNIFLLGTYYNLKIYRPTGLRYKNELFMTPMRHFVETKNNVKDTIQINEGIRGSCASVVCACKLDSITYFKNTYKKQFYEQIKNKINNGPKFDIPWGNKKVICIHLRIDDRFGIVDNDSSPAANYITNLIENDNFKAYDRSKMFSLSKDKQAGIKPNKLIEIIEELKKKYDHEIHVVYSGNLSNYIKVIQKYNITTHTNTDFNLDLWYLIHSDILILSKSNFSLVSGYLHQGSQVYAPLWGIIASTGLNSKYDKSGWKFYV